jgi:hypothetical protein
VNQDREITREELHQLVWSEPTRTATNNSMGLRLGDYCLQREISSERN